MATETDKVNTGALGTIVVVGVFATLSVALSVTALVRYSVDGVVAERQGLAQQGYKDLRREQNEKLGANPTWTDKGKGLVSIPIERAKLKVLTELAKDPTSATPPAPPSAAPAEGAAPAPATSGESGAQPAPSGSAAPAPTAQLAPKSPAPAVTVASDQSSEQKAKPARPARPAAPTAPSPAAKPTDG